MTITNPDALSPSMKKMYAGYGKYYSFSDKCVIF